MVTVDGARQPSAKEPLEVTAGLNAHGGYTVPVSGELLTQIVELLTRIEMHLSVITELELNEGETFANH